MKLKKYRYVGPCDSSVSLTPEKEGGTPFEVLLFVGKEVELPENNEYVDSLVFQGLLEPIASESVAPKAKRSKSEEDS